MTDIKFKELAELYGINIQNVDVGKGGLFFKNNDNEKKRVGNLFALEDYSTSYEIFFTG